MAAAQPTLTDLRDASAHLDPGERALLNLWLHRGLDDADIAQLSGLGVDEVAVRRRTLVGRLAELTGADAVEVRAAIEGVTQEAPPADAQPSPPGPPTAESEARPEPQTKAPEARPEHRSHRGAAILIALLVGAGVVALVLLAGGSDDKGATTARTSTVNLTPVPGGPAGASGKATVDSDLRLSLSVTGLAPKAGPYEAWLYTSVLESVSLGRLPAGSQPLELRLPAGYRRYRFIDVSRQPAGSGSVHSGESVLRGPVP